MAAVAIPMMVVGAAVDVYGTIKSAQDQADMDRQKAALENEQAQEVVSRQQANDAANQTAAIRTKLDFAAAYGSSGREGTGLGSQLEIQRQVDEKQKMSDREAMFQAKMLNAGAGFQNQAADQVESAGYISAAGTLLGAGGKMASNPAFQPARTPQNLPSSSGGH